MRVLIQELRGECGARGALRGEEYDVTREGGLLGMTLRWRGRGKGSFLSQRDLRNARLICIAEAATEN